MWPSGKRCHRRVQTPHCQNRTPSYTPHISTPTLWASQSCGAAAFSSLTRRRDARRLASGGLGLAGRTDRARPARRCGRHRPIQGQARYRRYRRRVSRSSRPPPARVGGEGEQSDLHGVCWPFDGRSGVRAQPNTAGARLRLARRLSGARGARIPGLDMEPRGRRFNPDRWLLCKLCTHNDLPPLELRPFGAVGCSVAVGAGIVVLAASCSRCGARCLK